MSKQPSDKSLDKTSKTTTNESTPPNKGTANTQVNKGEKITKTESNSKVASTVEKTPPKQPPTSSATPTTPPKKGGNGLAFLALVVALASGGLSAYNYQMAQKASSSNGGDQQTLTTLAQATRNNAQTIESLQNHILSLSEGLDKSEVSQMIVDALQEQGKASTSATSSSAVDDELLTQKIQAIVAKSLEDQTVAQNSTMDNETIAKLTQELSKAQKSVVALSQAMQQQQEAAQPDLSAYYGQLLLLATLASECHDYVASASYLKEASHLYNTQLKNNALLSVNREVDKLAQSLSALPSPLAQAQAFDTLLQMVAELRIKDPNVLSVKPKEVQETKDLSAKLGDVGKKVLSQAFQVSENDASGLVWINQNPNMQFLLREQLRLDLNYARQAALAYSVESYQQATSSILKTLNSYFEQDSNTQKILHQLEALKPSVPEAAEELQTLFKEFSSQQGGEL